MTENTQIYNLAVLEDDICDLTEEEIANISGGNLLLYSIGLHVGYRALKYYFKNPVKASSSGYSLNGRNPSPY